MIKLKMHSDIDASALSVQTSATTELLSKLQHLPMTGWLTLPRNYDHVEFKQIKNAARQIQKDSQYLVCIGIGGSYLGHRALIEALQPQSPTKILYAGNSLSTRSYQNLLHELGDADFSVNVISKSGTTTEPAIAFRLLKQRLIEKYGEKEAYSRIYATTDAKQGALHDEAVTNHYTMFRVPDDIGGRYSVLSAVGLLPLAASGVDIDALMTGATAEANAVFEYHSGGSAKENEASNTPVLDVFRYAAIRHLLRGDGHDVEVLSTFEPSFAYFNEWWKQLFGESEGKDDQGVFPASTICTTDLHSLGQFLQQGRKNIFETFITAKDPLISDPVTIPETPDNLDQLNYLAGKTLDYVNSQAEAATITAHAQHIPVLELQLPDFNTESFGSLIYFFELACALSATLQGSNPFNQPGVETYKQEMFRLLGRNAQFLCYNIAMTTLHYAGPVVLAILDGVGLRSQTAGNAFARARTDFLDSAMLNYLNIPLQASGEFVGILPNTMGNSEVGHNALGSGQIIRQGIAKIDAAFKSGEIWDTATWRNLINNVKEHDSTLHLSGIFSDGGVHSTLDHLFQLIRRAAEQGITRIRIHAVLDGRDTPPQSADTYIKQFNKFIKTLPDSVDCQIASGGGRMIFVADRYEADWSVVKTGWDAIVHGKAPHTFTSALAAVQQLRLHDPDLQDQYLPPFVVVDQDGHPIGQVHNGDSFIYFDFRADRAVEIAEAFTYQDFPHFDRGTAKNRRLDVYFAGLTEYNSDLHVPEHQLVPPVEIHDTLNHYLSRHHLSQYAISETVKFGHVTYYFNGNSHQKARDEVHQEIPSDTQPFNTRPWMKSAEITDALLDNLEKYNFLRINYPGGDMVGHLGDLQSTITAMEAIDIQLKRIAQKVDELGGILVITADHGNAEELTDYKGRPKTSHTTNLVPCIFYDNTKNAKLYAPSAVKQPGLANVAATIATLLGHPDTPASWQPSLIHLLKREQQSPSYYVVQLTYDY